MSDNLQRDDDDASAGRAAKRRSLQARVAAHASWAKTVDRTARTASGTRAFLARFERQVDPHSRLSDDERSRMAQHARTAYMLQLARRSEATRRRRRRRGVDEREVAKVTGPSSTGIIGRVGESWVDDVLDMLRRDGAVVVSTAEVGDVEEWRRTIRQACRVAGLRIRTGATKNGRAWVEHLDHVVTEAETRAMARALDNAWGDEPKRPFHELVREEQRKQLTVVSNAEDVVDRPHREVEGEAND